MAGASSPAGRVFVAAAAVAAAVAAGAWWVVLARGVAPPAAGVAGLAVAAAAVEAWPLRVEIRRQTQLISLSELPLVLGLLTLPAWSVGAALLVGGGAVFAARRDGRAAVFNLSLVGLEVGVAALVLAAAPPVGAADWGRVAAGALAGSAASAAAVGWAYRLADAGGSWFRLVARSLATAAVVVTFTLTGFALWVSGPAGRVLAVGWVVVWAAVYRGYAARLREHTDMAKAAAFARGLSAGADWAAAVEAIREQFNARAAVLHGTDPQVLAEPVTAGTPAGDGPAGGDDAVLRLARSGPALLHAGAATGPALAAALAARGARDLIAAPLSAAGEVVGVIEVYGHLARRGRFRTGDLLVLQALAGHLAVTLANRRLLHTLDHRAVHDPASGLLNDRGLARQVDAALAAGTVGGLLVLHVHAVTGVAGTIGYAPELITAAAARLRDTGPAPAAHLGSGQFALALPAGPPGALAGRAEQVLARLAAPYPIGDTDIEPGVSAGLAPAEPAVTAVMLQRHAQAALLHPDPAGRLLRTYQPALDTAARRHLRLAGEFRQALADGQIDVFYQPQRSLRDWRITGVEALARWHHPALGPIPPGEFVPVLEAAGAITLLLAHILDRALAQQQAWSGHGLELAVSVNLSARDLLAPTLPAAVTAALARHRAPPGRLTLEITETATTSQPERTVAVLGDLHRRGIRLSLDDFGTGYSSMASLWRLPLDEIKIDKSFVQGMATDPADRAIVHGVIDLAHRLGLTALAEGVEEETTLHTLAALGCDAIQGYLLARPMPAGQIPAWIRAVAGPARPAAEPAAQPLPESPAGK